MRLFVQTIRFRLTVLYSGLLIASAALLLGAIYFAVANATEQRPYTVEYAKAQTRSGQYLGKIPVVQVEEVENAVNVRTMETLRNYSIGTLAGLFLVALVIGWVLAGRALRPIRSITRTAAEIQATDLARRINLEGPRDELRDLAETVDTMLGRLEDAFRAQRQLIDDASHELRSPLAIIRANLDAVLAAPEATEEERHRAVAIVDRATTRMTRLVEDLLASARRQAPAFVDADVDLAAIANEACEEFAALALARNLTLRRRLRPGLSTVGDHDALRRAVGNLISNAVRLAPPGTDVTVAAGERDGWVWAAVRDAGPGIAEDERDRVFDRFWRGHAGGDVSSRRDRHTGLGLAIVRQIVESHGGQVRVFSELGTGSTFVLWLPGPNPGAVPEGDPMG
ncbi:sensor histidine kinase [Acrocarpospora phusangensis]|uniref:sensor histidine kinase n=1 Tax=Acrocarpospora phusangensis TaxID=1070424 RepID=UPI0019510B21|nr:HAMP domain-containing sensor histidine kinase [Acrocarpospora phusangensis]